MTTAISFLNGLDTQLDLVARVEPDLSPDDWKTLAEGVGSRAPATGVLQFNRNEGITRGKTWVFTTSFTVDGVEVKLQEQVTGTLLSSDMMQSMTAGEVTTGFVETNEGRTIRFDGTSGAKYQLSWELSASPSLDMNINYKLRLAKPAYRPIEPVMTQIDTVVYLMLENRSLDNVLGWLYANGKPAVVFPPGSSTSFDGIPANAANYHDAVRYAPAEGTAGFDEPWRVPAFDPYEPYPHVEKQLYANAQGEMPSGNPWKTTPPMTGFASDYFAVYEDQPGQVMGAYNAEQLPVLYGLAENFAVSDRWFSSIPTQTDPNRAFAVCGTSLGKLTNEEISDETYKDSNTIFNALGDNGKSWGLYWQYDNPLATGEPLIGYGPYTPYYFSQLQSAPNGKVDTYKKFLSAAKEGTLPNFCFLEPWWGGGKGDFLNPEEWVGIQGNDYHPPAYVGPAEADLDELYQTLTASPQWSKMLFVITFDEHGGTYDHVPPTPCVAPDSNVGSSGFCFERLGVRVPTILASPYVAKNTVFRAPAGSKFDLDHTSFIASVLKWAGVDPASAGLGARVAVAPTFEGVLTDAARKDVPRFSVPDAFAKQGGGTGHLNIPDKIQPFEKHLDVRAFRAASDVAASPTELRDWLKATAREK